MITFDRNLLTANYAATEKRNYSNMVACEAYIDMGNVSWDSDTGPSRFYERYAFISAYTLESTLCILILGIASMLGTFGNIVILAAVVINKKLHTVESIFICNLAISDSYVTLIAIPFSITAKSEGKQFFDRNPGLCQTIASLCTVSCVTSLMSIGLMSVNRFFYVCKHEWYNRIFTKWNCICLCISLYFLGGIFVLLNAADIGDHGYDEKSLECMLDRTASYPYTVAFTIILVWLPSTVIGACYLRIYVYVRQQRKRIVGQTQGSSTSDTRSFHLAKSLFIIYAVFTTCWTPYALVLVMDKNDTFPQLVHMYISMFAHLHPSLNWLIYYITNTKFSVAYKMLFRKIFYCFFHRNSVLPREQDGRITDTEIQQARRVRTSTNTRAHDINRDSSTQQQIPMGRLNETNDNRH